MNATIKKNSGRKWFTDRDSPYRQILHGIKKHIVSTRTKFQKVDILDTYQLGRVVVLDEKIQSAETDEYIYHESLVHPAMVTHRNPAEILILGAGEGATLREVIRHPTVRRVTMIDIDEEFVHICKKYLGKWHRGAFADQRLEMIHADAFAYLKDCRKLFDVILADISDPSDCGPSAEIYTRKFYSRIKKALKPDGIFVTHSTAVPDIPGQGMAVKIFRTLRSIFAETDFYYEYIPSFGSAWSYSAGSMHYSLRSAPLSRLQRTIRERDLEGLAFYDAETHARLFSLPKQVRSLLLSKNRSNML